MSGIRPPEAPEAGSGHLSALWGLRLVHSGPIQAFGVLSHRKTILVLGDGPLLSTSGGLTVQLPSRPSERRGLGSTLEAWAEHVLAERYALRHGGRGALLKAYYLFRPLLPRKAQLILRRRDARGRADTSFLRWPIDGLFVALAETYLALALESAGGMAEVRRFWPRGYQAAAVLTHDVEGPLGQGRCLELALQESNRGFKSCFNFVAERYPLDASVMDGLRSGGFEIGVHGIKHDGKKFSSRRVFEARLEQLRSYQQRWGALGFRSPATHRRWEWMGELPFQYDSSYPDTDPYEPIPGGCGSPWPFSIGPVLELPITVPQDHTLWAILERSALPVWQEKATWLRLAHGLINIIVHPDYLDDPTRWQEYTAFLDWLKQRPDIWVALPREVAEWWLKAGERREVRLVAGRDKWALEWQP